MYAYKTRTRAEFFGLKTVEETIKALIQSKNPPENVTYFLGSVMDYLNLFSEQYTTEIVYTWKHKLKDIRVFWTAPKPTRAKFGLIWRYNDQIDYILSAAPVEWISEPKLKPVFIRSDIITSLPDDHECVLAVRESIRQQELALQQKLTLQQTRRTAT